MIWAAGGLCMVVGMGGAFIGGCAAWMSAGREGKSALAFAVLCIVGGALLWRVA